MLILNIILSYTNTKRVLPHEMAHSFPEEHKGCSCGIISRRDKEIVHHMSADSQEENIHCRICMEPFQVGDVVAIPKYAACNHFNFHSQCILPWLVRNNSCPICRGVYVRERRPRRCFLLGMFRWIWGQLRFTEHCQLAESKFCEIHGLILPNVVSNEDLVGEEADNSTHAASTS